jgi:hypothetical protein
VTALICSSVNLSGRRRDFWVAGWQIKTGSDPLRKRRNPYSWSKPLYDRKRQPYGRPYKPLPLWMWRSLFPSRVKNLEYRRKHGMPRRVPVTLGREPLEFFNHVITKQTPKDKRGGFQRHNQ